MTTLAVLNAIESAIRSIPRDRRSTVVCRVARQETWDDLNARVVDGPMERCPLDGANRIVWAGVSIFPPSASIEDCARMPTHCVEGEFAMARRTA